MAVLTACNFSAKRRTDLQVKIGATFRSLRVLFWCTFLVCMLSMHLPARTQYHAPQPFFHRRIGVEQGLSANWVRCFMQDRKGFVWVGTENGANIYDGKFFQHYKNVPFDTTSLPSGYAICIAQDSSEAIWIGTLKGLSRRDPITNLWQRWQQDSSNRHSLPDNSIYALLCTSDGTLWIGTNKGLCRLVQMTKGVQTASSSAPPRFAAMQGLNERIFSLYQDRFQSHILWIGTFEGNLFAFDMRTKHFTQYKPPFHLPTAQQGNTVTGIVQDAEARLWITRDNAGVLAFSTTTGVWQHYYHRPTDSYSLSYNRTSSIVLDEANGCLWLGTWGGGLNRMDLRTRKFVAWKRNSSDNNTDPAMLHDDFINNLLLDREGNLWCATAEGLSLVTAQARRNGSFLTYRHNLLRPNDIRTLPFNNISSIAVAREKIFIGTQQGIAEMNADGTGIRRIPVIVPHGHDTKRPFIIQAIAASSTGTVWAASADGIYTLSPKSKAFTRCNDIAKVEKGAFTRAVWVDAEGVVWMCDNSIGLLLYNPQTRATTIPKEGDGSGYSAVRPFCFAERINERGEREVWFGGYGAGLQRYNAVTKTFRLYKHNPANPRSLPVNDIGSVMVRKVADATGKMHDEIWCAPMNAGLCRLTNPSDTHNEGIFERFTAADGVPDVSVWQMQSYKDKIWCASQRGIVVLCPEKRTTELYGRGDGLPSLELSSCARLSTGQMFFGSMEGLVTFHADSISAPANMSLVMPKVHITRFEALFKPLTLSKAQETGEEAVEVEWQQNVVKLRFAAPLFAAAGRTDYRYTLEGFDADWRLQRALGNGLEANNEAVYSNLNPGEYTFRVQSSAPDGSWNEKGEARLKIAVIPPFWRTRWFLGAAFLIVLVMVGAGARYVTTRSFQERIRVLEELNRERERISQDIHDDVGSTLTRITLLTETLKMQSPTQSSDVVQGRLETIASTAREATQTLGEIIWAIKPVNNSLDNFCAFVREYVFDLFEEKVAEERMITCTVDIPKPMPDVQLLPETRRNAFLVIKESLNNAIKYANATSVRVTVAVENQTLAITVADDGCGFDVERVFQSGRYIGGNGLKNMQRRAEGAGGMMEIVTKESAGTLIIAQFPLVR
jgi:signal transduction histidine kinase/ligand-binding sensor domain-containing protein